MMSVVNHTLENPCALSPLTRQTTQRSDVQGNEPGSECQECSLRDHPRELSCPNRPQEGKKSPDKH